MATHKVKANIENALAKLAGEFKERPYGFLNESDAANHFCQLLNDYGVHETVDIKKCKATCKLKKDATLIGRKNIGLIHTEYPNFSKNSKFTGRYDVAILKREFIMNRCPEYIVRPNSEKECTNRQIDKPLHAVIEFKLSKSGKILLQEVQTVKVLKELCKNEEAALRYYVFFMRYQGKIGKKGDDFTFLTKKGGDSTLQKNWEKTCQAADGKNNKDEYGVQSIFVFYLPNNTEKKKIIVRRFGNWNKK